MPKLKEVWPVTVSGIFSAISETYTLPWSDAVPASDLDIDFMTSFGSREISPLIDYLITSRGVDGKMTDTAAQSVGRIVYNRFSQSWAHLWDVMQIEYEPLQNFELTTERKISRSGEHSDTESSETNRQQQGSDNTQREVFNDSGVYGFNSETVVPDAESGGTEKVTQTDTITGKDTVSSDRGGTTNENETYSEHTFGDNSARSTQYMIGEERQAWSYDTFKEIFKQVASVLTSPYYKEC